MANKDFIAYFTDRDTFKSILIEVETGKTIFEFAPVGDDYGHHWFQRPDGKILEVDYDCAQAALYTNEFDWSWSHTQITSGNAGSINKYDIDSQGNLWYFSSTSGIGKITVGNPWRESNQGFGNFSIPSGSNVCVGMLNGVEKIFIRSNNVVYWRNTSNMADNGSIDFSLYQTELGLASPPSFSKMAVINSRLVLTSSSHSIDTPSIHIINMVSQDPVTAMSIPGAAGILNVTLSDFTVGDGSGTIYGNTDGGNFQYNGNNMLFAFSDSAGSYYSKLNVTDGQCTTTLVDDINPMIVGSDDYTGWRRSDHVVLDNGNVIVVAKKNVNTDNIICIVELSSSGEFVRELWTKTLEYGDVNDSGYGMKRFVFDTYHVNGTITSNGTPVNGAKVGWMAASGKMTWNVTTGADGTYSLPVIGSGAKKIGAIVGGNMKVHMVTPV